MGQVPRLSPCNVCVGEVAVLSTDVLTWDVKYSCPVGRWPQLKTHKFKTVLIGVGANRLICPTHTFATAFASNCFHKRPYDPSEMNYFFTHLVQLASPAQAITNWLRAMVKSDSNTNVALAEFRCQPCHISPIFRVSHR